MSTLDSIKELLDDLGCEEVTFTRARNGDSIPVPAIRCKQSIVDHEGFPPTLVMHQPIYPTDAECLNNVMEKARLIHKRLSSKKKPEPTANNVLPMK